MQRRRHAKRQWMVRLAPPLLLGGVLLYAKGPLGWSDTGLLMAFGGIVLWSLVSNPAASSSASGSSMSSGDGTAVESAVDDNGGGDSGGGDGGGGGD